MDSKLRELLLLNSLTEQEKKEAKIGASNATAIILFMMIP
jgi:hypothetical protein